MIFYFLLLASFLLFFFTLFSVRSNHIKSEKEKAYLMISLTRENIDKKPSLIYFDRYRSEEEDIEIVRRVYNGQFAIITEKSIDKDKLSIKELLVTTPNTYLTIRISNGAYICQFNGTRVKVNEFASILKSVQLDFIFTAVSS